MDEDGGRDRLVAHAQRIRASGVLGKSVQINQLFDFLVERILEGSAPKEIEIAQAVFAKSTNLDVGLDATVRVCAHRLRKKLEEAPCDEAGERLLLPRGEYRLVVLPGPTPRPAGGETSAATTFLGKRGLWLAVAMVILAANVGAWVWYASSNRDPRLNARFWRDITRSASPTLLVSGDHYVFGERAPDGSLARKIDAPSIRSREDLDAYKMANPQSEKTLVDLNLHDLPEAMTPALTAVVPLVHEGIGRRWSLLRPITMSQFATDMLSSHNVIYLGLLSNLGDLRDPLFDSSGFLLADGDRTLIDRPSGRRYSSDWAELSEERIMRRDYAYLAKLPGPSGNQILVIAGTDDPALAEAAEIVVHAPELARLDKLVGAAPAFEALYEVRTFGPSNFSAHLILARPLRMALSDQISRPLTPRR